MTTFLKVLAVGLVAFVLLSFVEQIPVLGWFGFLVSIGLWAALASWFVSGAAARLRKRSNPSIGGMGWGALLGVLTALAGAITSFAINAATLQSTGTVPPGDAPSGTQLAASFNTMGSAAALIYWPFVGALCGGLFGMIWANRLRATPAAGPVIAPGTLSPDGYYFWNGAAWQPVPRADASQP